MARITERSAISFDENWLAQRHEETLDSDLPIIDAHHHLWNREAPYFLPELLSDTSTGHNIEATIYVECESMYRQGADPSLAPVGEVEFANGVAAIAESGLYGRTKVCAGIVGFADLLLGDKVAAVLELQKMRGGDRFKGIRNRSIWDADESLTLQSQTYLPHLLMEDRFRRGFARLSGLGLSFDGWLYHPQIPEFTDLARAFPDTTMILNHLGTPVHVGRYAGKGEEVFATWKDHMTDLARCENVFVKLGGVGTRFFGFSFDYAHAETPVSSHVLARAIRPYVETAISLFGTHRCMFESNFPVDKRCFSYNTLWNAFKRVAAQYAEDEKLTLFKKTAASAYRLNWSG